MNEKLNKLNIEYRKKWGIASHIDNTWWETYGDKVFKIGLEEGKKELASLQEKIEKRKVELNIKLENVEKERAEKQLNLDFSGEWEIERIIARLLELEEISKIFKEMGQ